MTGAFKAKVDNYARIARDPLQIYYLVLSRLPKGYLSDPVLKADAVEGAEKIKSADKLSDKYEALCLYLSYLKSFFPDKKESILEKIIARIKKERI